MNRHKHKLAVSFILACTAAIPLPARAQERVAAESLYNNGVQAYFRGSSAEAESSFSRLIRIDPKDPRSYYFRALSLMAQGRAAEARADMQLGAQLEARMPNRFDIGKTLERVQGPTRLMLEQYRSRARQAAAMNPPIGAVRSLDTAVLRARQIVPLDQFSGTGIPQSFAAPMPAQATLKPLAPATTRPAQALNGAPADPDDPFSDDAAGPAPQAQPTAPPAKAAAPETPPAEAPLPPAPQPEAPAPIPSEDSEDNDDNPFL